MRRVDAFQKLTHPAPTLLYPMEPRGIGTPLAESLASFTERVAFEHRVTTGQLLGIVRAHYLVPNAEHPLRTANLVRGGWETHTFASELAQAVGHPEVLDCALLPLRDALPLLDSRSLRYCPLCVQGWTNLDNLPDVAWPAWRPALWEIEEVKACPVHRMKLVKHFCGPALARAAPTVELPGVCGRCGSIGYSCRPGSHRRSEPHEDWIADQMGAVISLLSAGNRCITNKTVVQGVSLVHAAVKGLRPTTEEKLQIRRHINLANLKGNQRVLREVIAVCLSFRYDLSALLMGRLQRAKTPPPPVDYRWTKAKWQSTFGPA